jgi:hypothetical protein
MANTTNASMGEQTMSYGTVQAEKMTTESGYSLGAGNASSFKNRIINGAMLIDQRNNGSAVTVNTFNVYSVDRFPLETSSGVFTGQQSSVAPANFVRSLLCTVTTTSTMSGSTDLSQFAHNIEGLNVADLGWGTADAKPITLSFWVRSSVVATYSIGFQNSDVNRSYVGTYTINAANTWEYKTITVPGDTTGTWLTTNGRGLLVRWCFGTGSARITSSANVWAAGNNIAIASTSNPIMTTLGATFYITGVQLEVGTVATSFDFRSYGTEMMLCQRYYQQHGFYGVVGQGQNTDRNSGSYVSFFVPMRTTPTTIAKNYDVDIGDLNIAFTPSIYTDAIGQGIGWRPYRNIATTITRGDTMEIMANAGTEGGPRHPFNAEL